MTDSGGKDVVDVGIVGSFVSLLYCRIRRVCRDGGTLVRFDFGNELLSSFFTEKSLRTRRKGQLERNDAQHSRREETHSKVDVSYSIVGSGVERIGTSFLPKCKLLGSKSRVGIESVTAERERRVERDRPRKVVGEMPSDSRKIVDDGNSEGSEEIRGTDTGNLKELRRTDDTGREDDFLRGGNSVLCVGSGRSEFYSSRRRSIEDDFRRLISRKHNEIRSVVDRIQVTSLGIRASPLERDLSQRTILYAKGRKGRSSRS